LIIKSWVYGQTVDQPDIELNRIEQNTSDTIAGLSWVDFPVMTHKTDRVKEDYISASELNNIEQNCKLIADKYYLPFAEKVFASKSSLLHSDFNRWEQSIGNVQWIVDLVSNQLEYCGTFNCGQGGLI
jgi:hypothetical protein